MLYGGVLFLVRLEIPQVDGRLSVELNLIKKCTCVKKYAENRAETAEFRNFPRTRRGIFAVILRHTSSSFNPNHFCYRQVS